MEKVDRTKSIKAAKLARSGVAKAAVQKQTKPHESTGELSEDKVNPVSCEQFPGIPNPFALQQIFRLAFMPAPAPAKPESKVKRPPFGKEISAHHKVAGSGQALSSLKKRKKNVAQKKNGKPKHFVSKVP